MKECKRVLHVVSSMNRGGAETMLMNLYRHIDREKLQFDFVCHTMDKCDFEDEIYKLGGKIYRIKSLGNSGVFSYISNLRTVIKENGPYLAIHSHTDMQAGIANIAAIGTGTPIRICHSHNTKWGNSDKFMNNIMVSILKIIGRLTANKYVACGEDAARFFFGNKNFEKNKVLIINNGIDINNFTSNNTHIYQALRKELEINEDQLIIGHIGRFYEQKNHHFLIRVAEDLKIKKVKFKMLLVGRGPLFEDIKEVVQSKGLSEEVIFLGVREDVPLLMKIFDVFLFPSFYEGLPVVLIEAQATGLKCIISDNITADVDLGLGLINRINLNSSEDWIDMLLDIKNNNINISNSNIEKALRTNGYSVQDNVEILYRLYQINY